MVNSASSDDRNELRSTLRSRRRSLSKAEQELAAESLMVRVRTNRLFRASRRVAFYIANDGEIDPAPLMALALRQHKSCYLPILSRIQSDRLWFAPYEPRAIFSRNRFGIPEPVVPARHWIRANDLDLVFLPLVAFDSEGNRLGMGGGFYDRTLAFLGSRRYWEKPHTIGLAHELQRVPSLATRSWDIPLQGIITNQAEHFCSRNILKEDRQ